MDVNTRHPYARRRTTGNVYLDREVSRLAGAIIKPKGKRAFSKARDDKKVLGSRSNVMGPR